MLTGWTLAASFSQNKDELVLGFFNTQQPEEEFYLKALLDARFCCLQFPGDYKRTKKNSVDLFKSILGKKVKGVRQFLNERSFALLFEEGPSDASYGLLFKMHGNRSNVVLFENEKPLELFRNNLKNDETLDISALDRPLDFSYQHFLEQQGKVALLYPTLGPLGKEYLRMHYYDALPLPEKWEMMQSLLKQWETPPVYFIILYASQLHLSLIPIGQVKAQFEDPIQAINHFFAEYTRQFFLSLEKNEWTRVLEKEREQAENYLAKTRQKLKDLQDGSSLEEIANILMANLHQVPARATQVELFDFYHNQPIFIKLKKELSPQKNAEVYYRKAKNQKLEIKKLEENLLQKQQQLSDIQRHLAFLQSNQQLKELRQYVKEEGLEEVKTSPAQELPYRQFLIEGFTVMVGKNAKSNDTLLRQHTYKEDLWLHAKDVAGSHVIIKYQSGVRFSKQVIEKAAQLAAYYSKRKTDSLCPVIVTPRKYVRKSKDLAPGQVKVDREETILVEPKLVVR